MRRASRGSGGRRTTGAAPPPPHARFEVAHKALILRAGRLLMVRERSTGCWELPGGRVDVPEAALAGERVLMRELKEELGAGARIRIGRPLITWSRVREDGTAIFHVGWRCTWAGGTLQLSDEHDALRWLARGERPRPLAPRYAAMLAEVHGARAAGDGLGARGADRGVRAPGAAVSRRQRPAPRRRARLR